MKLKPNKLTKLKQLYEHQLDLMRIYCLKSLPSFIRSEILDDMFELNEKRYKLSKEINK